MAFVDEKENTPNVSFHQLTTERIKSLKRQLSDNSAVSIDKEIALGDKKVEEISKRLLQLKGEIRDTALEDVEENNSSFVMRISKSPPLNRRKADSGQMDQLSVTQPFNVHIRAKPFALADEKEPKSVSVRRCAKRKKKKAKRKNPLRLLSEESAFDDDNDILEITPKINKIQHLQHSEAASQDYDLLFSLADNDETVKEVSGNNDETFNSSNEFLINESSSHSPLFSADQLDSFTFSPNKFSEFDVNEDEQDDLEESFFQQIPDDPNDDLALDISSADVPAETEKIEEPENQESKDEEIQSAPVHTDIAKRYSEEDLNAVRKESEEFERIIAKQKEELTSRNQRIAALEAQAETHKQQNAAQEGKISQLSAKLTDAVEKCRITSEANKNLTNLLAEFEASLPVLLEEERRKYIADQKKQAEELREAKKSAQELARAFKEVKERHIAIKGVNENYRCNEEILKNSLVETHEKIAQTEKECLQIKKDLQAEIEGLRAAAAEETKSRKALQGRLDKALCTIERLEATIKTKNKENLELVAICDGLINQLAGK